MELTYHDDICVCLIHSDVVFLGPLQANLRPELEDTMFSSECFPVHHEHLKTGDST